MRFTLSLALLSALPAVALAQSVVTLDSFDLGEVETTNPAAPAAPVGNTGGIAECLFATDGCSEAGVSNSVDISIDDVRNLALIDTAAIPVDPDVSVTEPLPSIDLEVLFAYDSDQLTPDAMRLLATLSSALHDPRVAGSTLLFIGHTDAVGSAAYNQALSQRRADSVARFVMTSLGVAPTRVRSVGMGFSRLKNVYDPRSGENRRVQLVLVPGA